MLGLAILFLLFSFLFFMIGSITRFLGYGVGRGAPWAFGITPDAYLRYANTFTFYSIAFVLIYIAHHLAR